MNESVKLCINSWKGNIKNKVYKEELKRIFEFIFPFPVNPSKIDLVISSDEIYAILKRLVKNIHTSPTLRKKALKILHNEKEINEYRMY